jgi:YaiO family outer membrane protein
MLILYYSPPGATEEIGYDEGMNMVKMYIKSKEFEKAENVLKNMLTQYPDNPELLEILARVLYWQRKYDESIEVYERLLDVKPSKRIEKEMEKVILSRENLLYRVRRNSLMIKSEFYDYTKGIENEEKYTVQISQRLFERTFVLSYSNIDRFGMTDNQLGLDIYSKLGRKRWGYLSFTLSQDHDFLAKWSIGGAIYQGYGNFDFSLGYSHMEFKDSSVDRFNPAVFYYMPRGITLSETVFINPKKDTLTFLTKIHYKPNYKFNGFYSFAIGQSAVEVGATEDIEKIDQYSHKVGIEYRPMVSFSIGGEYYFSHRSGSYDKKGFAVLIRLWW